MGLDHWAEVLSSAVTSIGKAQVSENRQCKSLQDPLYCVTSPLPHTSLKRGKTIWFREKGLARKRSSSILVTNVLLVWICLSYWQALDLISLIIEFGGQISKVHFSFNLQSRWLHLTVPILPMLFLELQCPFLHSRLLFNLISLENKCGRDLKRELVSPEKQSCLHTNGPNTNVRYKAMF